MKNIAEMFGGLGDFLYLCSVVEGRVKEIIILIFQFSILNKKKRDSGHPVQLV